MYVKSSGRRQAAIEEFHAARLQANIERIRAQLSGKSADLLSFEEVRRRIHAKETARRELKEIPLDAIIGSVGRYKDFTRSFFPKVHGDLERWSRIHALTGSMEGLPPIEVYQIGSAYFVRDGNHRVSVARSQQLDVIEAYVTQVDSPVELGPDTDLDDLIVKERYAQFLERTLLGESHPQIDLRMSVAGNYRVLERQIAMHQWWVKEHKGEEITFPEAAARWYRHVYLPVKRMIHRRGLLRDFPGRTETDLYVYIDEHKQDLARELEWSVDSETAATDLYESRRQQPLQRIKRLGQQVSNAVTQTPAAAAKEELWEAFLTDELGPGLFPRVLTALNGAEDGWRALEQAIVIAQLEQGTIFGLHVVPRHEAQEDAAGERLARRFARCCREAGVPAELSVAAGEVTPIICDRARWTDLVVVSLAHPPGAQPIERFNSNFRRLLRHSPRPVLAVPGGARPLKKLLLAYDGSPKAHEALLAAIYMAGQWRLPLTVVTVHSRQVTDETAAAARAVLDQYGVHARFDPRSGEPAQEILNAAAEEDADLIILGGYAHGPLVEVVVESVIGQVLRETERPVLLVDW